MYNRQLNVFDGLSNFEHEKYWCLVSKTDKKKKKWTETDDQTEDKEEHYILCGQCENKITLPNQKVEIAGEFEHTFLNPGGHLFRIGCFQSADGCLSIGVPTTEWTWFEGFDWQVSICNQCNAHLGWLFRSTEDQNFFGLILDKLK